MKLAREIRDVLNRNSVENRSDTPDYVLAKYLIDCLIAFENATNARAFSRGEFPEEPQTSYE